MIEQTKVQKTVVETVFTITLSEDELRGLYNCLDKEHPLTLRDYEIRNLYNEIKKILYPEPRHYMTPSECRD